MGKKAKNPKNIIYIGNIIRNATVIINNNSTGINNSITEEKETKEIRGLPTISQSSISNNNSSERNYMDIINSFTFTENANLEYNSIEQNVSENNNLVETMNDISKGKLIII